MPSTQPSQNQHLSSSSTPMTAGQLPTSNTYTCTNQPLQSQSSVSNSGSMTALEEKVLENERLFKAILMNQETMMQQNQLHVGAQGSAWNPQSPPSYTHSFHSTLPQQFYHGYPGLMPAQVGTQPFMDMNYALPQGNPYMASMNLMGNRMPSGSVTALNNAMSNMSILTSNVPSNQGVNNRDGRSGTGYSR